MLLVHCVEKTLFHLVFHLAKCQLKRRYFSDVLCPKMHLLFLVSLPRDSYCSNCSVTQTCSCVQFSLNNLWLPRWRWSLSQSNRLLPIQSCGTLLCGSADGIWIGFTSSSASSSSSSVSKSWFNPSLVIFEAGILFSTTEAIMSSRRLGMRAFWTV